MNPSNETCLPRDEALRKEQDTLQKVNAVAD
jgi:hypothetical protein